jgi:hypothetical protein
MKIEARQAHGTNLEGNAKGVRIEIIVFASPVSGAASFASFAHETA